jgi:hypothetical protein
LSAPYSDVDIHEMSVDGYKHGWVRIHTAVRRLNRSASN